jgi:outer membrane protein, heavy metal efflux system
MKKISISLILLLISLVSFGQDTLKLSFKDAETCFLKNNLDLISLHYGLDANSQLVRQAKLWDNPVLSTDQNIFDDGSKKFFYHSSPTWGVDPSGVGQIFIQVSQVIKTAHKRGWLIDMAEDQTSITQYQFDDLVRNIRYSIHNDLLQISYYNKQESIYQYQIDILSKINDTTGILRSVIFGLKTDLTNVRVQRIAVESEIKTLLGIKNDIYIYPVFVYSFKELVKFQVNLKNDLSSRPDLLASKSQIDLVGHNLSYQKSLAYPDLNLGVEWDQRSSYAPNYWGLVLSIPLPVLNRNQFGIKSSKLSLEQQKSQYESLLLKSENDLNLTMKTISFYQQVNNTEQLAYSTEDFKSFKESIDLFKRGKISLSDFILSLNSFKDNRFKVLDQHQNLIKSVETYNFLTNKEMFKF